jgi:hypothetical protein
LLYEPGLKGSSNEPPLSRASYAWSPIVSEIAAAINLIASVIVTTHRDLIANGLITPPTSLFFFPLSSI